jgi:lipid II:glycine glycyltransferase (peptidoglycan interpeptide bridge formation enzyme)
MALFYWPEGRQLDDFISSAIKGSSGKNGSIGPEYLQSWAWGDILKAEGEEIIRTGWRSETSQENLAAATLVKKPLGAGYSYWYAPRGPIFNIKPGQDQNGSARDFFAAIKELDPKALFLRIEPSEEISLDNIKPSLALQPKQTLILDLDRSEEELLTDMHPKTRYNIRLAEKKGVTIKEGSLADWPEFWRLMSLTGERDGFRLHSAAHYKKLLEADPSFIKLFFAVHEGRHIATGLFCFWGGRATYLHGASDNEARNLMAPYLLQWSVIGQAKRAGFSTYDFYGIDEKKWPGVTRFKLGFGGRRVSYPGTYDVIFRPAAYRVYNLLRKIKRAI